MKDNIQSLKGICYGYSQYSIMCFKAISHWILTAAQRNSYILLAFRAEKTEAEIDEGTCCRPHSPTPRTELGLEPGREDSTRWTTTLYFKVRALIKEFVHAELQDWPAWAHMDFSLFRSAATWVFWWFSSPPHPPLIIQSSPVPILFTQKLICICRGSLKWRTWQEP